MRSRSSPSGGGELTGVWCERFHAYQVEQGKRAARDARYAWFNRVAPRLGAKTMAEVTRADIDDIRDDLDLMIDAWKREGRGHGKISGKTAMNAWSALTSAFKAAIGSKRRELRVLDGKPNPCTGVEPPGDRG